MTDLKFCVNITRYVESVKEVYMQYANLKYFKTDKSVFCNMHCDLRVSLFIYYCERLKCDIIFETPHTLISKQFLL